MNFWWFYYRCFEYYTRKFITSEHSLPYTIHHTDPRQISEKIKKYVDFFGKEKIKVEKQLRDLTLLELKILQNNIGKLRLYY
jgi:hypothetical protein